MATTNQQGKAFNVVVGVDYSDLSALALVEAVATARMHEPHHVHVVHSIVVVQPNGVPGAFIPPPTDALMKEAAEELKNFTEKALSASQARLVADGRPVVERVTTHLRSADPRDAITQLASDLEADLVVVGTHGRRGLSRVVLGSVAEGVVRFASCPVLVVRPLGTAASEVVRIEPPCPQCVETRRASSGKDFWCAQHREHHDRRHTYHYGSARSSHQSGLLIPLFR